MMKFLIMVQQAYLQWLCKTF